MAHNSIPVDLYNPGQVFACLGFLEAADVLSGDAEGGFDWSDEREVMFSLRTGGDTNPFEVVLEFLAGAEAKAVAPVNWRPEDDPAKKKEPTSDKGKKALERKKERLEQELAEQKKFEVFPSAAPETSSAMPIQISNLKNLQKRIVLGHWADGSKRNEFKLYSGNRSALHIATAMQGGIARIWDKKWKDLIERPFDITIPMGGSFNFDPRGAWTAIDAGYSPNDHLNLQVTASPVVEFLSAWGLENARPEEFETRTFRYAAWGIILPPLLARAALTGSIPIVPMMRFQFKLNLSGKNKIVTFSKKEIRL